MSLGHSIDGHAHQQDIRGLGHLGQMIAGSIDESNLLQELLVGGVQRGVQVLGGLGGRGLEVTEAGLPGLNL